MKKPILYTAITLMLVLANLQIVNAQDETGTESKPVRSTFESGILIDQQTNYIPTANTLELLIQHKFGTIQNGITDLYGIYAAGANVRIGFNYSILDNLMVGFGSTKNKKFQDFQVKWNVLPQTRDNKYPVAITLYGNMAIDAREKEVFGTGYNFGNRFSYFSQLIITRRFNDYLSLQVAPNFTHFNSAEKGMDHDKIGLSLAGRVKVSPQSSFLLQCDVPFKIQGIAENMEFTNPSKPNFAFGWEISTSTHAFQIYMGTASGILGQENLMNNTNDFLNGEMMLGFTITRLWSF
ncbi:MAG: hypothetical protein CVU06_07485 [Bacteroidetes bacterium HGW-Bacteroidetes-22]|nr:MAG: hypothetical protein CVU06_07485 [Bacteroidetes bacterium HGW-Bacteroidetes-22]